MALQSIVMHGEQTFVVLALRRLKQEDGIFKNSLSYIGSSRIAGT